MKRKDSFGDGPMWCSSPSRPWTACVRAALSSFAISRYALHHHVYSSMTKIVHVALIAQISVKRSIPKVVSNSYISSEADESNTVTASSAYSDDPATHLESDTSDTRIGAQTSTGSVSTPGSINSRQLYVGGLPYDVTEDQVRDVFKQFGKV